MTEKLGTAKAEALGRRMNKHARAFGAKHAIRQGRGEDGMIFLMIGPRKTRNHAFPDRNDWWVWGECPSPSRVVKAVGHLCIEAQVLDGEFLLRVTEENLIQVLELNRYTRPRYRRGAVRERSGARELASLLDGLED